MTERWYPNPTPYPAHPPSEWPAPAAASPPPPPPPPGGARRNPALVALAVLAALVLVVVAVALVGDDDDQVALDRPPSTTAPVPSTEPDVPEPPPATEPPPPIDEVVDELSRFVERERGLTFKTPVAVEVVDDEQFERRLLADLEESADDIVDQQDFLRALGLIDDDVDLRAAQVELLSGAVVGFYDPETDELVVRGQDATPAVRSTIVHELVHALDDQWFDLDRPALDDATDESSFGFLALVEGDAVRIEEAYEQTLTPDELDQLFAEELGQSGDLDLSLIPLVIIDLLVAPYVHGPGLVGEILDDGDQVRLDAAFALPPTTSEHVLDPSSYLAGEAPVAVPAPTADPEGEVYEEGTFGQLGLDVLLGSGSGDATEGWGGDAYVAWRTPAEDCVRVNVVTDKEDDFDALVDAVQDWAEDAEAAVAVLDDVSGLDRRMLTFARCG
ncbi:hypothetical protein BH20ACT2_BH20ACT2_22760 [soil metagenome]